MSESTGNQLKEMLSQLKADDTSTQINLSVKNLELSEHTEKEESIQTSIRIGKRSINRTHAHYPQFILLNHILGDTLVHAS